MRRVWNRNLVLLLILLGVGTISVQAEESAAARSARMKREFEQQSKQMKNDFEKLKKQNSAAAKSTEAPRTKSATTAARAGCCQSINRRVIGMRGESVREASDPMTTL